MRLLLIPDQISSSPWPFAPFPQPHLYFEHPLRNVDQTQANSSSIHNFGALCDFERPCRESRSSINLRGDLDSTNGRPSVNRELSVHSPILTSLSDDEAKHKASAQSAGRTTFRVIGAGGCGTIFRMKDCSKIVKIASSMHSNALRRNFRAHLTAYIKWSSITSITSRYRSPLRAALACATSILDFTPSSLSWASLPQAQE